jgi:hypothetical protein
MSNPPLTPATPNQPSIEDQPAATTEQPAATPAPQTNFNIGEEYGTARKSLPPVRIVLICLAVVVAIATIYSLTHRAHPQSSGSIDNVVAAAIPGQNMVMVGVNVSLQNNEQKPAWIKAIQVSADVGGQKQSDDAAPAVDAQRYLDSFPDLKQHALQVLTPEARINPGEKIAGTIVVSFPVTADAFSARKSLTVTITPYDEVPIVLTK